jgi:Domain of unknown function (DUF4124)
MPRWNVVVLCAMVGLAVSLPAFSQWKWRDKSGQTQYSDLPPPPGVSDKDILQRPSPTYRAVAPLSASSPASGASGAAGAAAPALSPRASEPELEARRKKIEQEAADKKKADEARVAATKADNCNRAKAAMRNLDSGMRMARTNEKGEREILDDTARAAEAKRTQDVIASDCAK